MPRRVKDRRGEKYGRLTPIDYFIAIHPEHGVKLGKVIKDFALEYNLDPSCVTKCLKGKREHHKGWTFRYATEEEIKSIKDR